MKSRGHQGQPAPPFKLPKTKTGLNGEILFTMLFLGRSLMFRSACESYEKPEIESERYGNLCPASNHQWPSW